MVAGEACRGATPMRPTPAAAAAPQAAPSRRASGASSRRCCTWSWRSGCCCWPSRVRGLWDTPPLPARWQRPQRWPAAGRSCVGAATRAPRPQPPPGSAAAAARCRLAASARPAPPASTRLPAVYCTIVTYSTLVAPTCWTNNPCQYTSTKFPLACQDKSGQREGAPPPPPPPPLPVPPPPPPPRRACCLGGQPPLAAAGALGGARNAAAADGAPRRALHLRAALQAGRAPAGRLTIDAAPPPPGPLLARPAVTKELSPACMAVTAMGPDSM